MEQKTIILEYLSMVNFKKEWSVSKIESDLKKLLGSKPTLDVKYKIVPILNEVNGVSKSVPSHVIDKISVVYMDLDGKINKIDLNDFQK